MASETASESIGIALAKLIKASEHMHPGKGEKMIDDRVLVTGAAGFIGYHLCDRLLRDGYEIVGVDNMNSYYDVSLKEARLRRLFAYDHFRFSNDDIGDGEAIGAIFRTYRPSIVINLAAQAGVRYSLENPGEYVRSNIVGFSNILENCREFDVRHLLYASSSSVYGGSAKIPFDEDDRVDHPISMYAATKRSNELMADCYAHLYRLPTTGLRFFTVYGPYGRPDMAYYSFADSLFASKPIHVFNAGNRHQDLARDFTYVDDVVEGVVRLLPLASTEKRPHSIYNIGGNHPERLTDFIVTLESSLGTALGRPVVFDKIYEDLKPGDVHTTCASTDRLFQVTGFKPRTSLREGMQKFADWYVAYHSLAAANGVPAL